MGLEDPFDGHAGGYSAYRPTYPAALFEYLASLSPGRGLAWDCGTGSGQVAAALAPHFRYVIASDISRHQVAHARRRDRVGYVVARAERAPLGESSVDLVTVAQALHWFDLPRFYAEVRRVGRPGSILAAWFYELQAIDEGVDAVVRKLYDSDVLGRYWPADRRDIQQCWRTHPLPCVEITPPAFRMSQRWDLHRLTGFLQTWTSAQRYRAATGADPLGTIRAELGAAWGDPDREREVAWPIHLRVGRVARVG